MKAQEHIENAEFLLADSKPEEAQAHALVAIAKEVNDQ